MTVVIDGVASMAFDGWTLQGDGRLTGNGLDIQLPPKEWHVLRLLLAAAGTLVSKDHLLGQVWPHHEATEESLTRCICSLRKHLRGGREVIKTVYGRGYRVTCAVALASPAAQVCSGCGRVNPVGGLR